MQLKQHHIMIDIESLALVPHTVILSIGAVRFEPRKGDEHHSQWVKFYSPVDVRSQDGRKIDASTVLWWLKQPEEARKALAERDAPKLSLVLEDLADWIRQTPAEDTVIWANGVTFDIAALENAFMYTANMDAPWLYQNVACMRTLRNLCPADLKDKIVKVGTSHNALDDAIWQALYVRAALRWMKEMM